MYSYRTNSDSKVNPDYIPPATEKLDRLTALRVLQDLSSCMYPNLDLYGNKTLVINRDRFEKIRAKYLDKKE